MNAQENPSTEEYVAEFNQRMSAMAEQQRRAFALLLAERVARSEEELFAASRRPLRLRLAGWFRQQATGWMRKHERGEELLDAEGLPDTESVIIVDAVYRVIEPNEQAKGQAGQHKEKQRWEN